MRVRESPSGIERRTRGEQEAEQQERKLLPTRENILLSLPFFRSHIASLRLNFVLQKKQGYTCLVMYLIFSPYSSSIAGKTCIQCTHRQYLIHVLRILLRA